MENEVTQEKNEIENNQEDNTSNKNIVEQAREQGEQLTKILQDLKEERQKLEILKANEMLSGTTGGHAKPVIKEVSDKEYAEKVMAGEVPNG